MNQRETFFIYCLGCILLCCSVVPVLGTDELMYSSAFSNVPSITDQFPLNDPELAAFSEDGGVYAMIQRLKGNETEKSKDNAKTHDMQEISDLNAALSTAEVQSFDASTVTLDEDGNYIPQFPAIAYAQGIFGASFSASGVEGYSDGTVTSSYAASDSTTVAGYVTQFVKKYHYVSGVDQCADGGC